MNEKLQILNMVEENKITAKEGVELLDALDHIDTNNYSTPKISKNNSSKFFKIRVRSNKDGDQDKGDKVDVTLPLGLLNIGLKLADKFSPEFEKSGLEKEDIEEIIQAVESGADGKLIDVKSDDGTTVEILIE